MKTVEHEFCMKQFKVGIAALAVLIVFVVAWTGWHCVHGPGGGRGSLLLAAATPTAPPIRVKDKMLHPYWGNCSGCHITVDAGKPVSKVMAGPPIAVKDKMLHEYWGNCLMCHKVMDGFQAGNKTAQAPAKAAALTRVTAQTLGFQVKAVNGAMMRQLGLPNEDGVLVLEVTSASPAAQSGLAKGDEIITVDKVRVETLNDFQTALAGVKPGTRLKLTIYRGKKKRNLFIQLPDSLPTDAKAAAATAPMTQNQVETLAEQLGVPKTQQDVARALQQQNQNRLAAATAPMTQNQVETLAEQLGVPKTQQDVARALQQQQNQNRVAAATAPMTQNQVETLAEQLGVPKTQQDVARALQQQQNQNKATTPAAFLNNGKVAVACMGPGLHYGVASQFGSSPYFVVLDSVPNSYRVVPNPYYNSTVSQDIQTGQFMVDLGARSVIAGNFSPDAMRTLSSMQVTAYPGVTGSARNAISAYMAGQLNPGAASVYPRQAPLPMRAPVTGRGNQRTQTLF
jgi:predicted Fe-Mo cluster-binding NifX family protein